MTIPEVVLTVLPNYDVPTTVTPWVPPSAMKAYI